MVADYAMARCVLPNTEQDLVIKADVVLWYAERVPVSTDLTDLYVPSNIHSMLELRDYGLLRIFLEFIELIHPVICGGVHDLDLRPRIDVQKIECQTHSPARVCLFLGSLRRCSMVCSSSASVSSPSTMWCALLESYWEIFVRP
jgi:hypothetical protein